MQAQDIMEAITTSLSPEMTIEEAVCHMRKCKRTHGAPVKGMVVIDDSGELVGILSYKDIIQAMIPSYLKDHALDGFTWEGMMEKQATLVKPMLVKDIMTSELVSISPDDNLMTMAELVIEKQLQRLPVKEDGKVVGVVYIRDLYNVISQSICRK